VVFFNKKEILGDNVRENVRENVRKNVRENDREIYPIKDAKVILI